MVKDKPDKKADIKAGTQVGLDRGERTTLMEPLVIPGDSRYRSSLNDLSFELVRHSASFRRSLPEGVMNALSVLVRSMNCYYSNLIEGHNTHPVDIERALNGDYSKDRNKRNLQLEAKAHIMVQQWIDGGALRGKSVHRESILEIHKRFGELLPADLLVVVDSASAEKVQIIPGELRTRDVQVGSHVAISAGAVPRFLERFEKIYANLGTAETILAAAAIHHRLLWIHPFLDGNGRVARLVSHAQFLDVIDTGGVWSVARGLARNVGEYKRLLMACDERRRNDFDGRGNLSEQALAEFTQFFLQVCLDQVKFMETLVQPNRLRERILLWVEEEIRIGALPPRSGTILEAVLYRGELPRGDVADLLGTSARHARRPVSSLIAAGVLTADSDRAPLRLSFPATLASRWMPGLFPD